MGDGETVPSSLGVQTRSSGGVSISDLCCLVYVEHRVHISFNLTDL